MIFFHLVDSGLKWDMGPGKMTPEMAPGRAPKVAPEMAPGIAPEAAPEMAPGTAPGVAPEFIPGICKADLPAGIRAPRSDAILGEESGDVPGAGQSTSTPESRATNAL